MSNALEELYLKYVNGVGRSLKDDRYFQYLYELIGAGDNVIHQTNRVLHKTVDEQWLNVIEESLGAINDIIEEPRRFVTTGEETVPVALARKITADSVRHPSTGQDGDIQPADGSNAPAAGSPDLYENRFIYHLIQRLAAFIDKRADVIFRSTGDETENVLSFQSAVDDAYETIDYKLEMTVKNKQSFAENDSDNTQTFMRIDRVRRMVTALKNSSFCDLMAGCPSVPSPIQPTSLMTQDPSYQTCCKLWHFLESYDEVGYTVEERDRALELDEEHLFQLYTHFITGYAVFKILLPTDERPMDDQTLAQDRQTRKPRFLKQIKEEEVTDPDLPDVEIRRVFVEGVTKAQVAAEEALAQEKKENEILRAQETELVQRLQEVLDQLDAQAARLTETENTLRAREADLAGAREKAVALEQEAQTQLQALADGAAARLSATEAETQSLREELAAANAEAAQLRSEKAAVNAEVTRLQEEMAQAAQEKEDTELLALREELVAANAEAAQLRDEKAAADTETQSLREELAAANAEAAQLRDEKAAADTEILALREELAAANAEAAQLREEKAAVDAEVTRLQEELAAANAEAAQLRDEKAAVDAEVTRLQEELSQAGESRTFTPDDWTPAGDDEQTESLRQEVERLRQELAAADTETARLREEKAAVDAEAARLREELSQAGESRTFTPDDWTPAGDDEQTESLRQELAQALQAKEEAEKRAAQAQREAKTMMAQAAEQRAQAEVRAAEATVRAAREAEARLEAEKQAQRGLGRLFSGKRRNQEQGGEG